LKGGGFLCQKIEAVDVVVSDLDQEVIASGLLYS